MARQFFLIEIFLVELAFYSLRWTAESRPMSRVGGPHFPFCNDNQHCKSPPRGDDRDNMKNKGADIAYCISTSRPLPKRHVCDGKFHCPDLSDEYLCTMTHPAMKGGVDRALDLRPQNGTFLKWNRRAKAQGLSDFLEQSRTVENALDFLNRACIPGINHGLMQDDGTTVYSCDVCKPKEILCATSISNLEHSVANQSKKHKMCVSQFEVCDRVQQCPGGEDELYCEIGMKSRLRSSMRRTKKYKSKNGTKIVATCESLRIGIRSFLETAKSAANNYNARRVVNQAMIHLESRRYETEPWPRQLRQTSPSLFSSESILNLDTESSNKSLTRSLICDHEIDCPGGIDEMVCPRRFYCQSGSPLYVNSSVISDGVSDCEDGSDEWFAIKQRKWSFASKDRMVKDWYVLTFMWLVGIFAIFGNSMVIVKTLQSLLTLHRIHPWTKLRSLALSLTSSTRPRLAEYNSRFRAQDRSRKVNTRNVPSGWKKSIRIWDSVFILNLATADFLMGVYLIILGIVSLSKTSNYWEHDRAWRTSFLCQSLGVIVVLSSQTSVLTLVGLTTLRLATVLKPFGLRILKRVKVLSAVCVTIWVVSLLIAIIPVMPGTAYSYATDAWMTLPHVRPPVVNRTTANDILLKTIAFSNNATAVGFSRNDMSWRELEELSAKLFPSYSHWKYFGFYSAHSVCLPMLFVSIGDVAWKHTTVFLSLNLAAFMYILAAYLIIYRLSKRSRIIQRIASERCTDSARDIPTSKNKTLPSTSQQRFWKSRKDTRSKRSENSNTIKSRIQRRNETQKMQIRVFLLVATDCVCWVPVCVLGFMQLFGYDISSTAYTVSAVGLLPINSALNPILYSNCLYVIPKMFCRRK